MAKIKEHLNFHIRGILLFLLSFTSVCTLTADGDYKLKILRVNTENFPDAIYVEFTVTDSKGDFVKDLPLSAFSLKDNSRTKYGCNRLVQDWSDLSLPVDVVFLIDNSGSMQTYQKRVEESMPNLVDCLESFGDVRVGLMRFGQASPIFCPEQASMETYNGKFFFSLADEVERDIFKFNIWCRNVQDGGVEQYYEVLNWAAQQDLGYRQNAQKVFVMLGDEPVSGENSRGCEYDAHSVYIMQDDVAITLGTYGIQTFAIQESNYHNQYTEIAFETGGYVYDISQTDYSNIVDRISNQIKGRYIMRYCLDPEDVAEICDDESRTVTIEYKDGEMVNASGSAIYHAVTTAKIIRTPETQDLDKRAVSANTDIPISLNIQCNDNIIDAVTLYYRNNGESKFHQFQKEYNQGSTAQDVSCSFTIPAEYVKEAYVSYYVEVQTHREYNGLISYKNKVSSPPYYIDDFAWNIAVDPGNPPLISKVKTTPATPCGVLKIYADVEDDNDYVSDVILRYRVRGTPAEYVDVAMTRLASSDRKYVGLINSSAFIDQSVEYYIIAKDNTDLVGRYGTAETPIVITPDQIASSSMVNPMDIVVTSMDDIMLGCEPMTEADTIAAYYSSECDGSATEYMSAKGVWNNEKQELRLTVYGKSSAEWKDGYDEGEPVKLRLIKGGRDYTLDNADITYSSTAGVKTLGGTVIGVREPRLTFENEDGTKADVVDFGTTDKVTVKTLTIRNTGCDDLLLIQSDMTGSNISFKNANMTENQVIKPGEYVNLEFEYVPIDRGEATLCLHTNPGGHIYCIPLKGDMQRKNACSGIKVTSVKDEGSWLLSLNMSMIENAAADVSLRSSCEADNRILWSKKYNQSVVSESIKVNEAGLYKFSIYKGENLCEYIIDLKQ